MSALQVLNPTVAKRGHVWFDAPRAYYRLRVSGGYESGQLAYVDLVAPVAGQKGRDDWKQLEAHSDFDLTHLPNSLADAPLTSGERAQIYKVTDDMGARLGPIGLAEDGSQQILVESCGALQTVRYGFSFITTVSCSLHLTTRVARLSFCETSSTAGSVIW